MDAEGGSIDFMFLPPLPRPTQPLDPLLRTTYLHTKNLTERLKMMLAASDQKKKHA